MRGFFFLSFFFFVFVAETMVVIIRFSDSNIMVLFGNNKYTATTGRPDLHL